MSKRFWSEFYWKDVFHRFKARESKTVDFLISTAFFAGCENWELDLIKDFLHSRHYRQGEYVFELGHPGAALYFVKSGNISIEIPSETSEVQKIADLSAGAFFGELALIDDSPRSASARATEETVVLALPRTELDRMIKESPKIATAVYRSLANIAGARLKSTLDRLQQEGNEIRLVANG